MSMAICPRTKEINQSVGVRENSLGSSIFPQKKRHAKVISSRLLSLPFLLLLFLPFYPHLFPLPPLSLSLPLSRSLTLSFSLPFFLSSSLLLSPPFATIRRQLFWFPDVQLVYRNFPSIRHQIGAAEGSNTHGLNSYLMLTDTVKLHSPYCVIQSNISLFMIHVHHLFFFSRDSDKDSTRQHIGTQMPIQGT